ncbi:response regulator [Devosia sp. CAU 1758]
MNLDGVGVFLVEDEPLLAMSVEDMIIELGGKVTASAASLTEAMEKAGAERFDCALLDINLGGREVFPVANILAERGIPFAFSSGYGASGLPEAYSARPVVSKPYNMDQLSAALRAMLAR